MDDELSSRGHVISCPGALHIMMHGLDAQPQDRRNLPIGLSERNEPEALDLAPAEARPGAGLGKGPKSPRCGQRSRADQFGAVKPLERKLAAAHDRE